MELDKKINLYNIGSIVVSVAYLAILGYFTVSLIHLAPGGEGLGLWFLILIFIPLSSVAFASLVSVLNAEPILQVRLSYGVFGVFALVYIYFRLVVEYVNNTLGELPGLGTIDYILFLCGFSLLIPAIIGHRRIKSLNKNI